MRTPRSRLLRQAQSQFVHITSKLHHREPWWDDATKESFRRMMWKAAEFSGVRVLAYCIMSNHFHILVEIPPKGTLAEDRELIRRYRLVHSKKSPYVSRRPEVMEEHLTKNSPQAPRIRRMLQGRMHDASEFSKTLKQRAALMLKHREPGRGPVWDGRFHSVIVQDLPHALQTVAAYLDLNPVRAGLVADPKDYRFCGYAEALAGSPTALVGLRSVVETHGGKKLATSRELLAAYRLALFGKGAAAKDGPSPSTHLSSEKARTVRTQQGKLPLAELLSHRLRWIAQGGVLGTAEFVERWRHEHAPKLKLGRKTRGRLEPFSALNLSWSRRLRGAP